MIQKDLLRLVAVQFPEPGGYCIPFQESALPVDIKVQLSLLKLHFILTILEITFEKTLQILFYLWGLKFLVLHVCEPL